MESQHFFQKKLHKRSTFFLYFFVQFFLQKTLDFLRPGWYNSARKRGKEDPTMTDEILARALEGDDLPMEVLLWLAQCGEED